MHRAGCRLASWSAKAFAHPLAIIGLLTACFAYWHWHHAAIGDPGVFALSVFSLTTTQLVLLSQANGDRATHRKLDELIHGVPDADDNVAGIEGR